jgi:hypothetical protein
LGFGRVEDFLWFEPFFFDINPLSTTSITRNEGKLGLGAMRGRARRKGRSCGGFRAASISGRKAFLLRQRFEIGDVGELFDGVLGSVELDDVHILEVGELAVNRAGRLSALEEDRLTFSECHAGRVGQAVSVDQWRERGREGRVQGTGYGNRAGAAAFLYLGGVGSGTTAVPETPPE